MIIEILKGIWEVIVLILCSGFILLMAWVFILPLLPKKFQE